MQSYKINRVCEDLKREITDILHLVKDPRVKNQILTVMDLSLTKDMSLARVYISSMDGAQGSQKAVEGLSSAKGFIKKEISHRLQLRKIPDLEFIADNSVEDAINLFKKIEQ